MDVNSIKQQKALIVSVLRTTKNTGTGTGSDVISQVEDKFLLLDPTSKAGGISLITFPDTIFPVLLLERKDGECKVRPLSENGEVDKLAASGNYIVGEDCRFSFFVSNHPIPIYDK